MRLLFGLVLDCMHPCHHLKLVFLFHFQLFSWQARTSIRGRPFREIILTAQHSWDESILHSSDSHLGYVKAIFTHEVVQKLPTTDVSFFSSLPPAPNCFCVSWVRVKQHALPRQNNMLSSGSALTFGERCKNQFNVCLWTALYFSYTAFKLPGAVFMRSV